MAIVTSDNNIHVCRDRTLHIYIYIYIYSSSLFFSKVHQIVFVFGYKKIKTEAKFKSKEPKNSHLQLELLKENGLNLLGSFETRRPVSLKSQLDFFLPVFW